MVETWVMAEVSKGSAQKAIWNALLPLFKLKQRGFQIRLYL